MIVRFTIVQKEADVILQDAFILLCDQGNFSDMGACFR